MSAWWGSTCGTRGWVRSRLVASVSRLSRASASASSVASTVSIWGTAWTTSPGNGNRSYDMRWAKRTSGNRSARAEYGLPVPGRRGVSWLPVMTTRGTPWSRMRTRARWAIRYDRYVGRGWSKMSPSHTTRPGDWASASSMAAVNDSSKSRSRWLNPSGVVYE
jgi:hypothetical protein